jgi:hypothetical protein
MTRFEPSRGNSDARRFEAETFQLREHFKFAIADTEIKSLKFQI